MTPEERRRLLEQVAAGDVSVEDAASRLHAGPTSGADERGASRERPGPATATVEAGPAKRIAIEVDAGSVRIEGDPRVAVVDVVGDGDHEIRDEGDTVVVRCSPLRDELRDVAGQRQSGTFSMQSLVRRLGESRTWRTTNLRVNPDLPLALRCTAGSARVLSVTAPIDCKVDAGHVQLHDVVAPLTAKVNAGSLELIGAYLTGGTSTVSCDVGSVTVSLHPQSDVTVDTDVDFGRSVVDLGDAASGPDRLGAGTGRLSLSGSACNIAVTVRN
ncbi:MAG: hypothetical protein S0880_01210 [Actinomycetota bacterium]|nr:hypothetical protein [Actinomycetota bacterium]